MHKLYAVYDMVAGEVVGPIFQAKADQVAIRQFNDVASDPRTIIGQHPADFQLMSFGTLEGFHVKLQHEMILSGSQWLAMQERKTGAQSAATAAPISLSDKDRHDRMTK